VKIVKGTPDDLTTYGTIPIAFDVKTIFEVEERGGGWELVERPVETPHVKDYDSFIGNKPGDWRQGWDLENWGFFFAMQEGHAVGAVAVACRTSGMILLEDRDDLAVLWDIRVRPEYRGRKAGHALFAAAERWAVEQQCRAIKVETQNINVQACRFYASCGCDLRAVHRNAYPLCPDEIELLWYKTLVD
jgi:GNAT superfamily N-acetyltransferase